MTLDSNNENSAFAAAAAPPCLETNLDESLEVMSQNSPSTSPHINGGAYVNFNGGLDPPKDDMDLDKVTN